MGVNGTSGILQVLRYVGVPYGVNPIVAAVKERSDLL